MDDTLSIPAFLRRTNPSTGEAMTKPEALSEKAQQKPEKKESHARLWARRQSIAQKIIELQDEYNTISDKLKAALEDDSTAD